jgi:hypothetical protein
MFFQSCMTLDWLQFSTVGPSSMSHVHSLALALSLVSAVGAMIEKKNEFQEDNNNHGGTC